MPNMDALEALDEPKDAGVEKRSAQALAEPDLDPVMRELQRFRIRMRREIDVLLVSFNAHLRAATALQLGGTTFPLVLFYTLLR